MITIKKLDEPPSLLGMLGGGSNTGDGYNECVGGSNAGEVGGYWSGEFGNAGDNGGGGCGGGDWGGDG